jgi:ferric-dicitrate binding protein FerR (iron transport regulator)
MSRNDLNDSTVSRLCEAADWLQRLHEAGDDVQLLKKCQRWLDQAIENAAAFERMEAVWQAVGRLTGSSRAQSLIAGVAQPPACRCIPAAISTVKQQLSQPARISLPPAQA